MFFKKKSENGIAIKTIKKKNLNDLDFLDRQRIEHAIHYAEITYDNLKRAREIQKFVSSYSHAEYSLAQLVDLQKEFPNVNFGFSVSELFIKFHEEKGMFECNMVDNWIKDLGRILLNYTTEKGKQNNFNKAFDRFRYDADQLEESTFDYLVKRLNEIYPEYMMGR